MNKKENISDEELKKLKQLLAKYEIELTDVAAHAQVSYRSVMYFFSGRNSDTIHRSVKHLIGQKIYAMQKQTSEMTADLCTLF
ncbi:MAG: hypothetical protein RIE86_09235 [Imperialibacter sp.]|uniref:hypothetical protein n=1 Tax=Imperialibacter sp. TaxID=2038411 RepID=UPI0032EC8517